jgi:hypothetical protein
VVAERAVVGVQLPLIAGTFSAPEPDVALVPGRDADYDEAYATAALPVAQIAAPSCRTD